MTRLKPGDRVDCHIYGNNIFSPYKEYDGSQTFEIISSDEYGYYLYIPDYINISGTTRITISQCRQFKIHTKFVDCDMFYITDSAIFKVNLILGGNICTQCGEHFPMSEPNQEDGSFACWHCLKYPFYK